MMNDDSTLPRRSRCPTFAATSATVLAAKLDGHRAKDEPGEQEHEGEIEAGKRRGINRRKSGKERPTPRDQPYFVTVPHRADRVHEDAALFIFFREEMQRTDAEIEAIEHRVAGEEHPDEQEPDEVKIEVEMAHGGRKAEHPTSNIERPTSNGLLANALTTFHG
ncbi:MAG: hypothetical protein WDN28_27480 [Chthoniobacter sp.]